MQWQLLVFSMVPVAIFVAVEAFGAKRLAIPAALVAAAFECALNSVRLGFLEPFSLASLGSFLVLGLWSMQVGDAKYFKLQPVVLGVGVAATFLIYQWVFDTLLFAVIVEDHLGMREIVPVYQRGYFSIYVRTMAKSIPYLLLLHAGLTAVAALKLSSSGWFLVRTLGLYVLMIVSFIAERLLAGPS